MGLGGRSLSVRDATSPAWPCQRLAHSVGWRSSRPSALRGPTWHPRSSLLHMSSPGNADFLFLSREEEAVLQKFLPRPIWQGLCFPKCIRAAGVTLSSPAPMEGYRSSGLGYGPGCSPHTRSWSPPRG